MSNLLNEEIMAIKHTMSHLKMAIPLEIDYGKKHKMKQTYDELQVILEDKLEQCGDYKG